MKENMKKPVLAVLGVAGACAACCAIPLAIPLLGGLSLAGAGFMSWDTLSTGPVWLPWGVGALATAALVMAAWFMLRRKNACPATPAAPACSVGGDSPEAGSCGCAPSKP